MRAEAFDPHTPHQRFAITQSSAVSVKSMALAKPKHDISSKCMHAEEKQGKNKKHSQQNIAKLQNPEARCAGQKHHPTPLWQNQKKLKWETSFRRKTIRWEVVMPKEKNHQVARQPRVGGMHNDWARASRHGGRYRGCHAKSSPCSTEKVQQTAAAVHEDGGGGGVDGEGEGVVVAAAVVVVVEQRGGEGEHLQEAGRWSGHAQSASVVEEPRGALRRMSGHQGHCPC